MHGKRRRRSALLIALLCVPAVLAATPPASAAGAMTLSAEADAYVRSSFPDSNYGLRSTLQVDSNPEILQSFLRFTVPSGEGPVVSAHLRLYATDASGNGGTLYQVADASWGETTITWNDKPAIGAAVVTVGVVPLNDWVDLDVGSVVTGPGTYSFAIATTGTNGSDYSSRQNAAAGNRPQLVVEWSGAGPDTTAPSVPEGLTAEATSPTSVSVSWLASTDDTGVTGYGVYRDGELVGTPSGTSWTDDTASPGTTHRYAVDAVDAAGNRSVASADVEVTTPPDDPGPGTSTITLGADADAYVDDATASTNHGTGPTLLVDSYPDLYQTYLRFTVPPGGSVVSAHLRLFATNGSGDGGSLYRVADTSWGETTITWNTRPVIGDVITAVGAVPLGGWVELDVTSAVTGTGAYSFAITSPSTNGSDYASRQNATVENRPQLVVERSETPDDTTAPSVPQGFTAEATSPTSVAMSWEPSTDDTGVVGYGVYRDDVLIATTSGTTATDDTASPGTTHHYEVDAVDAAGNRSATSPDVEVTTPPEEPGPTILTVGPDADAYVRSQAAGTNYGARTTLGVDTSPVFHTYIRFTVPAWVTSATGATLRLFASNGTANSGNLRVTTATWGETTLTWNNRPVLGSVVAPVGPVASGQWKEIDVSSVVTGAGSYGFALEPTSSDGADYASKEASDPALRPQLVVTTVSAPDGTSPTQPRDLTATATGPAAVVLSWTASTDDTGVAGYVLFRDGIQVATPGETTYTDLTVEPSTSYTYAVEAYDGAGNRSVRSDPATVTTPAPSADPVTVAAVGDVACDPEDPAFNDTDGTANACRMRATKAVVDGIDPDVVLMLGDAQENEGAIEDFMASYDQVWGVFKPITRPVPGNREYNTPGAAGYYEYFGSLAGDPGKGYYSIDVGPWHVIALNSNCTYVPCEAGSPQEQWLRADLAAHPGSCTLAMFHHPRFSSRFGTDPDYEAFWEAFDDGGVDLVLNGHAHFYERFAPQTAAGAPDPEGTRQFVLGTGGASHANTRLIQPNSESLNNGTYGVLQLTLRDGGYDWSFVPEEGATFTDVGSGSCH